MYIIVYLIGPKSRKSDSAAEEFAGWTCEERETRHRDAHSGSMSWQGTVCVREGLKTRDAIHETPSYVFLFIVRRNVHHFE